MMGERIKVSRAAAAAPAACVRFVFIYCSIWRRKKEVCDAA
jgi:hypothetical protein